MVVDGAVQAPAVVGLTEATELNAGECVFVVVVMVSETELLSMELCRRLQSLVLRRPLS